MKLKRFTTQLVAAGLIAVPLSATAAGLGKLSVTSALGQPLAAEIELFAADKAELASLSASLASDQAFRDARVDFAPILSSLRFTVVKKPNGKAVLKVTSSRPVNDPFLDMLVELNWASGRLVREYTMLLDPPGTAVAQTVAPVVVATEPVPAPAPTAAPKPAEAVALAAEPAPEPAPVPAAEVTPAPAAEPAPEPAPQPAAEPVAGSAPEPAPQAEPAPDTAAVTAADDTPAAAEGVAMPDSVTVKRGDTLSHIASRLRPDAVSLEQTLIGLYRENPHAFDGNVNRLKAGKTLSVPSADKVAAIPQQEAVRELKLQAADWRAYRQKLAAAVSAAPEAQPASGQASSGKITPEVEDRAEPAPAAQQDVLKLSKATPAAAAKTADNPPAQEQDEDATARAKAQQESGQRVAMLEKQIEDMQKLAELKADQPAEAAAAEQAPAAAAPADAAAPEPEPLPVAPAVEAPQAAPAPADHWYDPILADPLYWGGGLAALGLGGVLWWMMAGASRRRKVGVEAEDSLLAGGESRPLPAMAVASGGSVNTGDSSFLTDFSQAGLGTIDTHDVDPIAEAEVYMAYGRDAQAEEILKEAIGKNPDRHEVRIKLLEIYAARRNTAAFEAAAGELYAALGSKSSPLWDKACEMGRGIDPTNPLYGSGEPQRPLSAPAATVAATAAVAGGAVAFADEPVVPKSLAKDSLAAQAIAKLEAVPVAEPEPVFEVAGGSSPLDFESAGDVLELDLSPVAAMAPAAADDGDTQGLKFELPDFELPAGNDIKRGLESDTAAGAKYDFSGFDLDLGGSDSNVLDEVVSNLDLARAYVEMGDKEGAREILNEVLAEGSAVQQADAKGLMASLG
jgi:pilus assembly protein FimV